MTLCPVDNSADARGAPAVVATGPREHTAVNARQESPQPPVFLQSGFSSDNVTGQRTPVVLPQVRRCSAPPMRRRSEAAVSAECGFGPDVWPTAVGVGDCGQRRGERRGVEVALEASPTWRASRVTRGPVSARRGKGHPDLDVSFDNLDGGAAERCRACLLPAWCRQSRDRRGLSDPSQRVRPSIRRRPTPSPARQRQTCRSGGARGVTVGILIVALLMRRLWRPGDVVAAVVRGSP